MWSFQTEGFQYRTGFSRGLLTGNLEVDSPEKSVDSEEHNSVVHGVSFLVEKPISQVGI